MIIVEKYKLRQTVYILVLLSAYGWALSEKTGVSFQIQAEKLTVYIKRLNLL